MFSRSVLGWSFEYLLQRPCDQLLNPILSIQLTAPQFHLTLGQSTLTLFQLLAGCAEIFLQAKKLQDSFLQLQDRLQGTNRFVLSQYERQLVALCTRFHSHKNVSETHKTQNYLIDSPISKYNLCLCEWSSHQTRKESPSSKACQFVDRINFN